MNGKFIFGAVLFFSKLGYSAINNTKTFDLKTAQRVTVAVIDTGTDIYHSDLKDSIWINEGEIGKDKNGKDKSTNGVDDDSNGFADDIHGWNFVDNTNNVIDKIGHGTHISGVIKREFRQRSAGNTLLALMILKYYSAEASDAANVYNTVRAIEYATKMNARIINYSGGGTTQNLQELNAIKRAIDNNILFIAAAGNNNMNTDKHNFYPANYPIKNIITVAASDEQGELVSFSNYGRNTVDIAAPGNQIYSTLPGQRHGFMSGTSQSTAFVSGAAAGLLAKNRALASSESVLTSLLSMSKFKKSLKGKTKFQMAMVN